MSNFSQADPDYGGRIAKLLAEYKAVSDLWGVQPVGVDPVGVDP